MVYILTNWQPFLLQSLALAHVDINDADVVMFSTWWVAALLSSLDVASYGYGMCVDNYGCGRGLRLAAAVTNPLSGL